MIIAKNLKKVYAPKKGVQVNALDDVSVKLPDTGMVFILGKSGSGKSTLLNVLGGLDTFDSGEIIIKDQSTKSFKQSDFDSYRNAYVGFIFQEYNILDDFTVGANIALAIELQGRKATNEEVNSILTQVDLAGLGGRKPNELSGGQKQRVAIARALVKNPQIIMADEPTGALDSNTGRQVFDTLKELSKTKLVLIVSHDREFSELYADRIIELADGKIISDVEYDVEASENVAEPNLTYSGKEITIKDGYELTEDDIVSINQYIKKIKSGATLVVNDKRREKIFKKTDESSIVQKATDKFKGIKSKLSIKNAFKLGSNGLKHKKVRLVFTILLSFIAFALFGLADVVASYDNISTCTSSLTDSQIDYASFIKQAKYVYGDEADDFYWDKWGKMVSSDDLISLKSSTGSDYIGVVGGDMMQLDYDGVIPSNTSSQENWNNIFPGKFSGITTLTQDLINEFGYTLVGGRLPEKKNEIVITKYIADHFVKQGMVSYNENNESEIVQIQNASAMIGKKLTLQFIWQMPQAEYEIVGILDTGFDISRYESLASASDSGLFGMVLYQELSSAQSYSLHSVLFTHPEFTAEITAMALASKSNVKGSFEIFKYKDKNLGLDNEENRLNTNWYSSIKKLSSIPATDIHWFGDSQTSLSKNQVILSLEHVMQFISSGGDNDIYQKMEETTVTGFEEEVLEFLDYREDYLKTLNYFSNNFMPSAIAYKFASDDNNWPVVEKFLKKQCNTDDITSYFIMWDEETQQNVFNKNHAIQMFIGNCWNENCPQELNKDFIKSYYNDFLSRYPEIAPSLIDANTFASAFVEMPTDLGGGYMTTSISLYRSSMFSIINDNSSIAFALEHFDKALADAMAMDAENQPAWYKNSGETNKRNQFSYYLNAVRELAWNSSTNDFDEDFANEYRAYCNKKTLSAITPDMLSNIAMTYRSGYGEKDTLSYEECQVVGVVSTTNQQMVVASDDIYAILVDPSTEGEFAYAVAPMPKDKDTVRQLVEFYYTNTFNDGMVKFTLENSVTSELSMIDELLEVLGQVFLYVGLGFAVFASLMLSNFIATSISYKKQEIGILRAIGSRSRDVFMIFFAESFIIAMINFVLSVVATGVVVSVMNGIFREDVGLLITFLNFGIRQIVLLLGVSLIVALIATFLPVKKIASMKPIDAIKNRK